MKQANANAGYIAKTLDYLFEPGQVVELRCPIKPGRTKSGYFNDFEKLAIAAAKQSGTVPGVYVTVNPVEESLLSRSANRVQDYAKETTTDNQILRRRFFLLDIDPVRPSGISSSESEHRAAIDLVYQVKGWLETEFTFAGILIADSGNGAHLMIRVDLPKDDDTTNLFKMCIEAVALHFEEPTMSFDRTIYNPARIWKVYGTLARKGDSTPERPHRYSKILEAPQRPWGVTPLETLKRLADTIPQEPRSTETGRSQFDLAKWITDKGLDVIGPYPYEDGQKWIFRVCPWDANHTNRSAVIIQRASGAIGASCRHNGCAGKRWHDLRDAIEPGWREKRFEQRTPNSTPHSTSSSDWPEPQKLPNELPSVPAMVPALIPESFRPWLCDIAERMQCPLDFPVIGAITTAGSLIGRQLAIRPKKQDDWTVIPNLWGGVVGRPGIMKTPALDEAKKPLQRLEMDTVEEHKKQKQVHEVKLMVLKAKKEEIQKQIKEAIASGASTEGFEIPEDEELILHRYMVNDSTVEKLGVLLNQNPNGLLLFRDELTGWLRTLDREGHENDRAFYLESWNGNGSYTYDRIGRGTLRVEAACVSILGGIQPGPLSDYLESTLKGGSGADGLLQRFQLLVYPDDPGPWKNIDRWPDTKAKNTAFEIFKKLAGEGFVSFVSSPGILSQDEYGDSRIPFLRFSPQGQEVFDDWRSELENKIRVGDEHPAVESHLSKYRSLMPSLALIFHVVSTVDEGDAPAVSMNAAKMACAWCDYLEAHARRVYHGLIQRNISTAHRLSKKIIGKDLPNPFTPRDVYRKCWTGLSDAEVIESGAAILDELGWIRTKQLRTGANGGRPTLEYEINPVFGGIRKAEPCAF
jgi:hypothetical protein